MTITARSVNPDWDPCPNCSSGDTLVNEFGVHHCRTCRYTWEAGWSCGREGSHRRSAQPKGSMLDKLEEAGGFYGYSSRRLYDQVRRGRVLGIRYENRCLRFHCEPNEVKGPLADVPKEVILPVGTKAVSLEVCPESVTSGRPYVIKIDTARQHPVGTFQCEPGYSGPMVRVVCQVLDPEPVDDAKSHVLGPDI